MQRSEGNWPSDKELVNVKMRFGLGDPEALAFNHAARSICFNTRGNSFENGFGGAPSAWSLVRVRGAKC